MVGLVGLSSLTQAEVERLTDRGVWLRCIQDIQDNIIHTLSDLNEGGIFLKYLEKVSLLSFHLLIPFKLI